jgi:hypothetical protein
MVIIPMTQEDEQPNNQDISPRFAGWFFPTFLPTLLRSALRHVGILPDVNY